MSRKKWRRPANPDYKPPVADQKQARPDDVQALRQEPGQAKGDQPATVAKVDAGSNAASGSASGAARTTGTVPRPSAGDSPQDAPKPQPFARYDLNVSDEEAQGFINEMTRFLGGVVRRTNVILGKVGFAGVRKTFAGDLPDADQPPDIEAAKKALPRSHPLQALIRYAMAASRLLHRILLTTKPHLFGRPSNAYKNMMHAAVACDKFVKGNAPPEIMREAVTNAGL
jgi:hypothetical protein